MLGKTSRDLLDLRVGHHGSDVELDAGGGKAGEQRTGKLALGVGDRNLDIDVAAPGGDLARLPFHGRKIVGEHLEGNRAIGNESQHFQREFLVIADSGLPHQGRICRKALDDRLRGGFFDALKVSPVSEDFYVQLVNRRRCHHVPRNQSRFSAQRCVTPRPNSAGYFCCPGRKLWQPLFLGVIRGIRTQNHRAG